MLQSDSEANEQIRKKYGVQAGSDGVKVRHFLDILANDVGYDAIAGHVRTPLKELKVASYYGCLLVRPPGLGSFDDPEHPRSLEKIVETLGATSVELKDKTRCCGASLAITHEETMIEMSKRILQNAKAEGADCIVTVCPLCQFNLDAKQTDIEARLGMKLKIPVLFLTQLMGLAFGLSDRELEIGKNFVQLNMSKSNASRHAVDAVAEVKRS
jgi:heterodisulfide reductase subunit B